MDPTEFKWDSHDKEYIGRTPLNLIFFKTKMGISNNIVTELLYAIGK